MTVRYSWQKHPNGPWYYRRNYPKDIIEYYEQIGKDLPKCRVVALRTKDKQKAAKLISAEVRKDDEEWARIRNGASPTNHLSEAEGLLLSYGIEPNRAHEYQPYLFMEDKVEYKRGKHIELSEQVVRESIAATVFVEDMEAKIGDSDYWEDKLGKHQITALELFKGTYKRHLTDAKHHYLYKRDALDDKKKVADVDRAFSLVLKHVGDKPLNEYRRLEVQEVIRHALASGLKTATVRKRLGTVRAAVNETIRDYELEGVRNAFEGFEIPNNGKDAKERESHSDSQLERLRAYVRNTPGVTADIIGMLIDTGARLAEIGGLWTEDVHLDAPVPYILIHDTGDRSLKTKASRRKVPLVGDALACAQRAMAAVNDSKYLFPRYFRDGKFRNDAASATLSKVMKRLECYTPHHLRHTMRTRLRNADVAEPRAKEIQGWSRSSIADHYGEQTALANLQADLLKTL